MSDKGAPIQNIAHFLPDIFCWSDAYECRLGAFDNEGNVWHWNIHHHLIGKNNNKFS